MTRLRFSIALAGLAVAALALTGCAATSSTSSSGSWKFTDDLGKTVTLSSRPTKIVSLNEIAVSLMQYGVDPVGIYGSQNIKTDPRFKKFDLSGVTQLGTSYGEIDEEKLAELKPDLIVADVYPTNAAGHIDETQPDFGFDNLSQQKQIAKIAPIVTIKMAGDGSDVIGSVTKLATDLGASDKKVAAAKKQYLVARDELSEAAKNSKLKVVVAYGDSDGYDVVKAPDDPELRMYSDLGVDFVEPTPKGYYWGLYSWENAGKAGGDLVLLSQYGYTKAEMLKQPTFADTAAAKAGQIQPWVSAGLDYVSQASYMQQLAGYIKESKPVTN